MKDITDADYKHPKKVCKDFRIKNLSEYFNLYVQSDTLLLADVFEHFCNKYIQIYDLDPVYFLSAAGLTWQTSSKKTELEFELLTDVLCYQW